MASNYSNSLYSDYEKVLNKLDKITEKLNTIEEEHKKEIKKLKLEHKRETDALIEKIDELNRKLQKKDELIEKLLEDRDKYKNHSNKNSSNSGKPSSTDMFKPKKTGANLYNSRIETNKKAGGQKGHRGHNLSKEKIEFLIKNNNIKVIEIKHTIKGNCKNNPIIKYKMGLEFNSYVEKHIFNYDENSNEVLPKEFYTDVTYTNELKALVVFMNVHNVLSINRLTEFFSVVSNNTINFSQGTIVNIMSEFSKKSTPTIDNIIYDVVHNKTMFSDETIEKINKQNGYVRNYSNENSVVYKSHYHKGHAPIKEDGILTEFTGIVMGDHDTTLNSYGSKRIECNVHLGRYTVEITQNTFDASWAEKMKALLETGNNTRKYAEMYGLTGFDEDNYNQYSKKFDEITEKAKEETKHMSSSFYKNKSRPLYKRLEKNKEKHLAYLKDFSLPYSNNLSESDLRIYKIKIKVSGGFRSKKGSDYFSDALSIIKTSIKRKENILHNILAIFNNKVLFAQ